MTTPSVRNGAPLPFPSPLAQSLVTSLDGVNPNTVPITTPGMADVLRCRPVSRGIVSLLLASILCSPYGVLAAPVPDAAAPAGQRPSVTTAGSVPVVNITAPNSSGVSHNKYSDFNVTPSGVVFNNATAATNSTLAGALAANPNLGGAAARTILNEVTGSNASLLNGPMEIAGSAARLILANPNGITCDGCGFINTPHVQLTTGRPVWQNGQLQFDVLDGAITIGQSGLTALATRLDLIARRIAVNGPVAVGEANLMAGRAYVDADTLAQQVDENHILASHLRDLPYDIPLIDISQSLAAGTIRLALSTDPYDYSFDGLGIRATASVQAGQDLAISGHGRTQLDDIRAGHDIAVYNKSLSGITIRNADAGNDLQVIADILDIPANGHWHAGNDIQIGSLGLSGDSWGTFRNAGLIEADRDLTLAFDTFTDYFGHRNLGTLRAGRDFVGASAPADEDDPDTRASFALHSTLAHLELPELVQGYGNIVNSRYPIGNLSDETGDPVFDAITADGRIEAGRNAHLALGDSVSAGGSLGGTLTAANDVHLWRVAPRWGFYYVPSQGEGTITAGNDLWIHDLLSQPGTMYSGGSASLLALGSQHLIAGRDVLIALPNYSGSDITYGNSFQIAAGRDIVVRTTAGFANIGGSLAAERAIDIQAAHFTNTPSTWITGGSSDTPRYAGCLTDHGGSCSYQEDVLMRPGKLTAGENIFITAGSVTNHGGRIETAGNISIRTQSFSNTNLPLSATWTGYYYEKEYLPIFDTGEGSGGGGLNLEPSENWGPPYRLIGHSVSGTTSLGEVPGWIQAGGLFTVAGISGENPIVIPTTPSSGGDGDNGGNSGNGNNSGGGSGSSTPPSDSGGSGSTAGGSSSGGNSSGGGSISLIDPPPASQFINTGHIGAGIIVVRADEIRNGYDPVADYYRQTALPSGSPFILSEAVDGGQMIADMAMILQGETVTNTGYMASGGLLAVVADTLENSHRNAYYEEERKVKGGKLYIKGDTVQPGGAMAAGEFEFDIGSLVSRSGEFIVLRDTEEATQAASSAFLSALMAELGDAYHYSDAQDNLSSKFKAKKQSGWKKLVSVVVAVVVTYITAGAASQFLWASVAQGVGAVTGSAAGQLVATGKVDWSNAFKAGLTAGITAGLTNATIFEGGTKSLNQLANIENIGGVVKGSFEAEKLASNLLAITGRNLISAGIDQAINGTSFGEAFRNGFVGDLAAIGANAIGQTWGAGSLENVLAHAGLGCAAAAAVGDDCGAGAVGGAGAAILNPLIDPWTSGSGERARTVEHLLIAMLGSGLLAEGLGLDSATAARAAKNETLNNYLKTQEVAQYLAAKKALADCQSSGAACTAEAQVVRNWEKLSQERDSEIRNCTVTGTCQKWLAEVQKDIEDLGRRVQELDAERGQLYGQRRYTETWPLYDAQLTHEAQLDDINSMLGARYQQLFVNARAEYMATHPGASLTDFNEIYGYNSSGVIAGIAAIRAGTALGAAGRGGSAASIEGAEGIPAGYRAIDLPDLPAGSRGIVDVSTGEIKVLSSAGKIVDPPMNGLSTIGHFDPPSNLVPGTTDFGNYAHEQATKLLQQQYPDVPFRTQVNPSQTGIDVIVPEAYVKEVGFSYAEIKPLSPSGAKAYDRQVQNWGYDPSTVKPIYYDSKGNVYMEK